MKNYFKKFSIMFVMSLILVFGWSISAFADDKYEIGVANLNGTTSPTGNSAKIGNQLKDPEVGWKRADDSHSYIYYSAPWASAGSSDKYYDLYLKGTNQFNVYSSFKFYGSKLRIIDIGSFNRTRYGVITIDGVNYDYNPNNPGNTTVVNNNVETYKTIVFQKLDLSLGQHEVKISKKTDDSTYIGLDAVDIDDTGYLLNSSESIKLDNTSISILEGQTYKLTATTTPAGEGVVWNSSDESVAKVDNNGNVTAVGEGTCKITATINDGSNLNDVCDVTVTKANKPDTTNSCGCKTNSYGILNNNTLSGFTQNNNNGGNNNSSNNSGNTNNSGNSGNNYSNNNNSNSNNNYYYYNNYYISYNTKA